MFKRKLLTAVLTVTLAAGLTCTALAAKNDKLYDLTVQQKATYLTELERYVNIDSGSTYEKGLKEYQGILMQRLKDLGAEVSYTEVNKPQAGYNIKATFTGTGKGSVLMLIHADTVFAAGTAAQRPFKIEGQYAYGPGVSDCKGGMTLALNAMELLNKIGYKEYGKVTILINPDEERSSLESRDFIKQVAKDHQYTLCFEPGIHGDKVMNWRKGIGRLTMEVTGRNAHAGIAPQDGRNATVELAHQILQLRKLGNDKKMTTVNWTLLDKTKTPVNVIPAYAWAQADVRLMYNDEYERILKEAQTISAKHLIPDTSVKLSMFQGRPPFTVNEKTDKMIAKMQEIYKDELGLQLGVEGSGGGSDANYAAIVGSTAMDGLGPVGYRDHAPDEHIDLNTVIPRMYLTARIIMELGK